MQVELWYFFAFNFFNGCLIAKICKKNGTFSCFWSLSQKLLIRDHETWFAGILWVSSGVCENGPYWPNYRAHLAPNRAKMRQYIGFLLFSWKLSAGLNLIYKLTGTTLVGVWTIGSRGPIFLSVLGLQMSEIQVFEYFVKKFPLDSHQSKGIFAMHYTLASLKLVCL